MVNDIFFNVKSSQIPCGKSSRSLWLYMLHPCQWFYIWLHCNTECTVFLCGWWQWWGSRVEMGFSCSCLSLTLAQPWINSFRVAEFSPSTCHTAGFPPLLVLWRELKGQRLSLNNSLHLCHVKLFNRAQKSIYPPLWYKQNHLLNKCGKDFYLSLNSRGFRPMNLWDFGADKAVKYYLQTDICSFEWSTSISLSAIRNVVSFALCINCSKWRWWGASFYFAPQWG